MIANDQVLARSGYMDVLWVLGQMDQTEVAMLNQAEAKAKETLSSTARANDLMVFVFKHWKLAS